MSIQNATAIGQNASPELQKPDTTYHFYIDAYAGNPGQEIVQVKGGQLHLLKLDGTEIQAPERFHSSGDRLGVYREISQGAQDFLFKLYTDRNADGEAEEARIVFEQETQWPIMWIRLDSDNWVKGFPDAFDNGQKVSDAEWQAYDPRGYENFAWNWEDK